MYTVHPTNEAGHFVSLYTTPPCPLFNFLLVFQSSYFVVALLKIYFYFVFSFQQAQEVAQQLSTPELLQGIQVWFSVPTIQTHNCLELQFQGVGPSRYLDAHDALTYT